MGGGGRYVRIVEWSDEDECFIGSCPELFYGGCHGDDPRWLGIVFAGPRRLLGLASRSRSQVEKVDPSVPLEIPIKGDQAVSTRHSKCGEVGVYPVAAPEFQVPPPAPEHLVESRRLVVHDDVWHVQPRPQRLPGSLAIERGLSEDSRIGEVSQQRKGGHAAEGEFLRSLFVPVAACPAVMDVVRRTERQPDASIQQIGHALPRPLLLRFAASRLAGLREWGRHVEG